MLTKNQNRILALTCLLSSTAFFVNLPLLPIYVLQTGDPHAKALVGVVIGVSFAFGALSNPLWGQLSDRYGARAMMIRSAIGVTAVYAVTPLAHTVLTLILVRIANGILAGFIPAAFTLASNANPEGELGRALARLSVARNAGGIAGAALGALSATLIGVRLTFLVAAAITIVSTILVLFFVPSGEPTAKPTSEGSAAPRAGRLPGPAWLNLAAFGLTTLAASMVQVLLAIVLVASVSSAARAASLSGLAYGIAGGASLLTGYLWGWLADRYGYRRLLPPVLLLAAVTTFVQGHSRPLILILVFVAYSLTVTEMGTLFSLSLADAAGRERRGVAFGLNNSMLQGGNAIGPGLASLIAAGAGINSAYGLAAGIFAVIGVLYLTQFRSPDAIAEPAPAT